MASESPNMGGIQFDTSLSWLDFRSYDDAWYGVRLVLEKETLIVKYCNFSDEFDEQFNAGDFKNLKDLNDFKERFRPTSVQLQDRECPKLIEGMTICASFVYSKNEVKFYDAVIDSVNFKDHTFSKGEEVCNCIFEVFWQHGPFAGTKTLTGVEHICLIPSGKAEIDPTLGAFLKMSTEKLLVASHNSGFISEGDVSDCEVVGSHNQSHESTVEQKLRSPQCKPLPQACCSEDTKSSKWVTSTSRTHKGRSNKHLSWAGQDVDLGGKSVPTENPRESGSYHFILIENLEKDLAPSTIVDFIHKHTLISCQAHVFPSLSLESYTRGIAIVDNQENLQKLFDFINNPAHAILSYRGRPWVITEKKLKHATIAAILGSFILNFKSQPCDKIQEPGDKIKVVSFGTEEYNKAKLLKELFMEFSDHLQRLHRRLALEEKKIMQPANT